MLNVGPCQPDDPVGEVALWRQTQPVRRLDACPAHPVVRERCRDTVGALRAARLPVGVEQVLPGQHRRDLTELVEDPGQHVAEHQPEEDGDPAEEAAQAHRHQDDGRHHDQGDPLVLRPVDVGDDRREVEADQHHHGAGDDRRQHRVQTARAHEVDQHADRGEHHTGDEHGTGDVGGVATLGVDRRSAPDEGCRRTEIAGHLALHDEQEHDRRDPAHHDRQLGVESHQQREHERRAEHGDHVLGAQPSGTSPGEPLVRGHRLTRWWGPAPVHDCPSERGHRSPLTDEPR